MVIDSGLIVFVTFQKVLFLLNQEKFSFQSIFRCWICREPDPGFEGWDRRSSIPELDSNRRREQVGRERIHHRWAGRVQVRPSSQVWKLWQISLSKIVTFNKVCSTMIICLYLFWLKLSFVLTVNYFILFLCLLLLKVIIFSRHGRSSAYNMNNFWMVQAYEVLNLVVSMWYCNQNIVAEIKLKNPEKVIPFK